MSKLYKYHSVTPTTLGNFVARKVWASHPTAFNDPFEFRLQRSADALGVDELRTQNPHLSHVPDADLIDQAVAAFEKQIQAMGVVCYTGVPDDLLMWAHYAADHRGFCVEHTIDQELADAGIYPVEYTDSYPELNFQDIWHKTGLALVLWTKSRHWHYEHEYRSIRVDGNELIDYPGRLSKVIFGLRTTSADRDLIRSIIDDTSVEYQSVSLHPTEYKLQLNAI